jgi:predicted RND superfamily exporter protein
MVNDDFVTAKNLTKIRNEFQDQNEIFLVIEPKTGRFTVDEVCSIRYWLADLVAQTPEIRRIFSPFSIRQATLKDSYLSFPNTFAPECDRNASSPPGNVDLEVLRNSPWASLLLPKTGSDFTVLIYLRPEAKAHLYGSFDPELIERIQGLYERSVTAKHPDLRPIWSGTSFYQYSVFKGLAQLNSLNLLVLLLLFVFCRLFLGTWKSGAILSGKLFLCALPVYGLMGWCGIPIEILSNNLFILIAVSTVEDFVFISVAKMNEPTAPWSRPFRLITTPGFFTSLTTIVGFISLDVSDLQIIRRFGALAALGVGLEWIVSFYVLPAAGKAWPALRNWTDPAKAPLFRAFAWIGDARPPKRATYALLAVFPLAIFASRHFLVQDMPDRTFPPDHPFTETYRYLHRTRDIQSFGQILFEPGVTPSERDAVLAKVRQNPIVASLEDPTKALDYLGEKIPEDHRVGITGEAALGGGLNRYFSTSGYARAFAYFNTSQIERVNDLRKEIEGLCPAKECALTGSAVAYAEFGDRIRSTLLESLFVSVGIVAAILLFLIWQTGALASAIPLLVSALWGPALMLVLIGFLQVPIYFVTCIFAGALVGLTGDNTIQYLFFSRRDGSLAKNLAKLGRASLIVSVLMVALAAVFTLSHFSAPKLLGLLLGGGFIAAFVGDYWILKGFLRRN